MCTVCVWRVCVGVGVGELGEHGDAVTIMVVGRVGAVFSAPICVKEAAWDVFGGDGCRVLLR